jgi:hypothetical protein
MGRGYLREIRLLFSDSASTVPVRHGSEYGVGSLRLAITFGRDEASWIRIWGRLGFAEPNT